MKSTYPNEKRAEKRYEGIYVEYTFLALSEDYRHVDLKNCFLRNFSLNGACLYVYEPVPEDANIYLRVYDPDDSITLDIMGAIVWHAHAGSAGGPNARNNYNVGVKFINMNDRSRRRLLAIIGFLESKIPKRSGPIDYR